MKKVLSIILSVVMIFLVGTTAFAKTEKEYIPIIEVYGFGRTNLIIDKGEETEMSAFMPETDVLVPAIKKLIFPLLGYLTTGNSKMFAKALVEQGTAIFEPLRFNDDGEPVYDNISLEREPGGFVFRYDWRYDVMDTAKKLNEYIQQVKAETGCEKVALLPESMGGAVTMAYIYQFGYDDIQSVILRSSAMEGITLIGELFTRHLNVKTSSVLGFINGFLLGNTNDKVFTRSLVYSLGALPVSFVASVLNRFFRSQTDYVYDECLCDLFGNIPGLWSFVPDEYYEEAKKSMLDEKENAKLIEKIDVYHYEVRPLIVPMLKKMKADGVKVAIISHYGLYGVPAVPNDTYQSDFLVDTKYTSIGATCAPIGKTLGKDYTQKVDDGHNHISADNQIDASTCALPESTWFVKGMIHTWYNSGYNDFVNWIVYESETPTIYENPKYPQFFFNNVEEKTIDPLKSDDPDPLEHHIIKTLFAKAFKK